jgi:tetratricopeptide (TPR) repeat protein
MHERGAISDAAPRYSRVLKYEPKNVDALRLLGCASRELKHFTEAVELPRKAIKLARNAQPPTIILDKTLKDQGHTEEALASFHRAISHQSDFHRGLRRGRALRSGEQHGSVRLSCACAYRIGNTGADALPVTWCRLTKESRSRIPRRVVAIEQPAPVR